MAKLVSKTYGDALFEVALEENKLDLFSEEVRTVKAAMDDNPDLFKLMTHPKVVKEEKIKVIENILNGRVSQELVGLIRMIVDKGHFDEIDSVFTYFIDEVKEYRHIGTAYVTSAVELTDAQKSAIEKRLLETTKYVSFEIYYKVDPAIIGGLMIRIGDRVVDSSIRTKLDGLTRELSKIQLKAGECAS